MKSETFYLKTIKTNWFSKENSYYSVKRFEKKQDLLLHANKLIEKIPDPCNTKEHYQSFIRKKPPKSVKQK